MCFGVKFDIRRNEGLVAGGNVMGSSDEATYFRVVNIDTTRTYLFLEYLNGLDVAATDVGNAYLYGFNNDNI